MFQYHVKWDYDGEMRENHGLVGAMCYTEATERIVKRYGEREVTELRLEPVNDDDYIVEYASGTHDLTQMFEDF